MKGDRRPVGADRVIVTAVAASRFGPVRVASSSRGIVAVELLAGAEAFSAGLARRRLGVVVPAEDAPGSATTALLERTCVALVRMLEGEPAFPETIPVDIDDRPDWDRLVLGAVRAIPRGQVASYGEVARRIGRPGAARAVGGAAGRNPVGLLIPCHRVIAGDGSLGGYGVAAWGGREAALDVKRALLALEGIDLAG